VKRQDRERLVPQLVGSDLTAFAVEDEAVGPVPVLDDFTAFLDFAPQRYFAPGDTNVFTGPRSAAGQLPVLRRNGRTECLAKNSKQVSKGSGPGVRTQNADSALH